MKDENERKYWAEQLEDILEEYYSDEDAEEIGINKLTEYHKMDIIDEIIDNKSLWSVIDDRIRGIVERYCEDNIK